MNAKITQAANRADTMTHNFGRANTTRGIKHNGFDLRLENGERVGWYPTQKAAREDAAALGLTITK